MAAESRGQVHLLEVSVPQEVCSSWMTSVGLLVEECSSSGQLLVELREEEVGQMERCQKLAGLLGEVVVVEVEVEE